MFAIKQCTGQLTPRKHRLGCASAVPLLDLDALEPELVALRVDVARLLEQGTRLDPHAGLLFQSRRHYPERHRRRALANADGERLSCGGEIGWCLRLQQLGMHHVQFGAGGVDFEAVLDHLQRSRVVAVRPLEHRRLDPDLPGEGFSGSRGE